MAEIDSAFLNGGLQNLATNGALLNQNISLLIQTIKAVFPNLVAVPASVTANGVPGQFAVTASFLYICVANNTWRRVALSTF